MKFDRANEERNRFASVDPSHPTHLPVTRLGHDRQLPALSSLRPISHRSRDQEATPYAEQRYSVQLEFRMTGLRATYSC